MDGKGQGSPDQENGDDQQPQPPQPLPDWEDGVNQVNFKFVLQDRSEVKYGPKTWKFLCEERKPQKRKRVGSHSAASVTFL